MCTVDNQEIIVSDSIYADHWNYGVDGNAGNFGLNKASPVWEIFGNPATKQFDVQLSNFNNWKAWADPTYVAASTSNAINVGGFTSEFTYTGGKTITPDLGGTRFSMSEFGFGVTFKNGTSYYDSILNSDENYGVRANQSMFAMNYRGLGLPTASFERFSNLLAVVTHGESSCLKSVGGFCVLANTCDYYQSFGLWNLDFRILFTGGVDAQVLRVPLASFASNTAEPGSCVIYVEYLSDSNIDS
jgi:hypothetical protein